MLAEGFGLGCKKKQTNHKTKPHQPIWAPWNISDPMLFGKQKRNHKPNIELSYTWILQYRSTGILCAFLYLFQMGISFMFKALMVLISEIWCIKNKQQQKKKETKYVGVWGEESGETQSASTCFCYIALLLLQQGEGKGRKEERKERGEKRNNHKRKRNKQNKTKRKALMEQFYCLGEKAMRWNDVHYS